MNKNSRLKQGEIADKTFIDLDNGKFNGEFHLVQFMMRIERNTAHIFCHPVLVTKTALVAAVAAESSSSQKANKTE